MGGDVELADGNGNALELMDQRGEAGGEGGALGADADEGNVFGAAVFLDDFVRDPGERPADILLIHHARAMCCCHAISSGPRARYIRKGASSPSGAWRLPGMSAHHPTLSASRDRLKGDGCLQPLACGPILLATV